MWLPPVGSKIWMESPREDSSAAPIRDLLLPAPQASGSSPVTSGGLSPSQREAASCLRAWGHSLQAAPLEPDNLGLWREPPR